MARLKLVDKKEWILESENGLTAFDNEEEAVEALRQVLQSDKEGSVMAVEFSKGKIQASQLSWQDIAKYWARLAQEG